MSSRRSMSAALVVAVVAWGGVAAADMSRNVIAALKGELIVTKGDLPEGKTDKETIAKIKAERLKELPGDAKGDVTGWFFHYTAFLSKTGATKLTLQFITDDKAKNLAADKGLDGVDPKVSVLSGDISIDENEGLTKGKAYVVKLITDKGVVVAQTPLVMK